MLSRTFKSAAELGIPEHECQALIEVLGKFESGEIPISLIYMYTFHYQNCHCLCGWANAIDPNAFPEIKPGLTSSAQTLRRLPIALQTLFGLGVCGSNSMRTACGSVAIQALRTYLEIGLCNP